MKSYWNKRVNLLASMALVCACVFAPLSAHTAQSSAGLAASSNIQAYDLGRPSRANFQRVSNAVGQNDDWTYIFLPSILKTPVGIYGNVTMNGNPMSFPVELNLDIYEGAILTKQVTTQSGYSQSLFQFFDVPSLGSGQSYRVSCYGKGSSDRLTVHLSRWLLSYTAGDTVNIGSFDMGNIELKPTAGTVTLPYTFEWTKRTATPTDSYRFELHGDNPQLYFQSPNLGYADSFTLNELPQGANYGVSYSWSVAVFDPDGGYGVSFEFPYVTFVQP